MSSPMDRVQNESHDFDSLAAHRRRHHQPSSGLTDSPSAFSVSSEPSLPPGYDRKRQFSNSSNGISSNTAPTPAGYYADDGGGVEHWPRFVKLYVAGIPKVATEEEIRLPFGEHGNVIEVVIIKSKLNGEQLDCCFVKYGTLEEADRAIGALNDRYTFPGAFTPLKVRYADKERERLGTFGPHLFKLYVGCVNKQATQREIAEIFSPFGVVEDVFIVRGEMRQHRGCAFVQFMQREMAVAAINALHGSYIMRGCDQPLIVRFADPKRPKGGGSRGATNFADQVPTVPNELHPMSLSQLPNKRCKPQLGCASNSSECGLNSSSSSPFPVFLNAEPVDSTDCDWSEHFCPDEFPYYFNCVTCESRWEKPDEYALYEKQLLKLEQQHRHISHPEVLSTTEVSQA